uniref:Calcium release activated channel regulator 2A n=1 Tax=Callorhinchus milii TaxID=7868 RepID=A0A4W3J215_CALMI|eukprot:gi/632955776/ref/XP_007893630.1/ PREDICTED: EF-hand calcium-binding domain-containing protein 4B [Callorhinchus milii]
MAALEKRTAASESRTAGIKEANFSPSTLRDGVAVDSESTEFQGLGRATLMQKAHEFFRICDQEDKGFIARKDMRRLDSELPLGSDELENVFDMLDADGNGYLTLKEFTTGFGEFLFGETITVHETKEEEHQDESLYQSQCEEQLSPVEDDEESHFYRLMETLGAKNLFENQNEIRNLWAQLRKDEPQLLTNFEEFLRRVSILIRQANEEKENIEFVLKRKTTEHGEEIEYLYEEMEQQIKSEQDKLSNKDTEMFNIQSQKLESELKAKERELEHLIQKQKQLEKQCKKLSSEKQEIRVENKKLKETNDELGNELDQTGHELLYAQHQLQLLHKEASHLQDEREMELYRVTEGLEREKTGLLKQLDLLREMNKVLRDERDMCLTNIKPPAISRNQKAPLVVDHHININPPVNRHDIHKETTDNKESRRRGLQRIISIEEDHLPDLLEPHLPTQLNDWIEEEGEMENEGQVETKEKEKEAEKISDDEIPSSPRKQPIGKESLAPQERSSSNPDRLFKVICIGDSSVGKTSFLRRFCNGSFHHGMCATVGIDYSVKTITVDKSQVAFQLWDTAGQERYRSITKQFFRKADGVVVMYDITDQITFTAVRHWLTSVQEGADGDIAVLLLGNKTDLDSQRQVSTEEGKRLAKENNLVFFECSACSGYNITEPMVHLARLLKEQEDKEKQKTIQLVEESTQKRFCCAR